MEQKYIDFEGKTDFYLIHGERAGGWIWSRLLPLLEKTGHGAFPLEWEERAADRARETLKNQMEMRWSYRRRPAILVGQDMGGVLAYEMAAELPFVEAVLGIACALEPPALWPEGRKKAEACSEADAAWLDSLLAPPGEHARPAVSLGSKGRNWHGKKYYLCCQEDAVVPAGIQQLFCDWIRPERVFSMPSDHFPQVSRPEELAYLLHGLGR